MKKLIICLLLVCLTAINFAGCTKQEFENSEETAHNTSNETHPGVPRILNFSSLKEVAEFKGMLKKSDEEVTEYLVEKSFNMNGINSKKDIESCFEKIGNLKIFHLIADSEYQLKGITYYIDYGYLDLIYAADSGKIRVTSYLKDNLSANSTKENATVEKDVIVKGKLSISNKTVNITSSKNATGAYKMGGTLDTTNSLVRISFTNEEILSQKNLEQNIVETTLNELMQQKQEK